MQHRWVFQTFSILVVSVLFTGVIQAQGLDPNDPCSVGDAAVLATNSVWLNSGVVVHGDVVVNDASPGPTLSDGYEINVDRAATLDGDGKADSIQLQRNATASGDLFLNDFNDKGATFTGTVFQPLSLPVLASFPVAQVADVRPDAVDVTVAAGATAVLTEADYGDVVVGNGGTVRFAGGTVDVRSIAAGQNSSITFAAPTILRIEGRLVTGKGSFIGPASGGSATAAGVVIHVNGTNAVPGALLTLPLAAQVGRESAVEANLYAANGTLEVEKDSVVHGVLAGRDVLVADNTAVWAVSAFADQPPGAVPGTAYTNGAVSIDIVLTGSDPEGQDLSFSIASGASNGSLSTPVEIVPDPVEDRNDPGTFLQPPVTQATVTYTPFAPGADLADSFTFLVIDGCGNTGMATVLINPPNTQPGDDPQGPTPIDTVFADEASVATTAGNPVTIHLSGRAPEETSLTFSIVSGPAHGSLGPVAQGGETPQRTATVVYTPDQGFVSPPDDSFLFEVCGDVAGQQECDQAEVTVTVVQAQARAKPQEVTTPAGEPVDITLSGEAGFNGVEEQTTILGRAAFLDPAEIAGSATDADNDGDGDFADDLPGPAPIFTSAGVDATSAASFDFETGSGFPASGGHIGVVQGIDFDAQTSTYSGATSGTQAMTGSGGTFTQAVVDFSGLGQKPFAFSYYALDLTVGEVVRVTVDFTNGPSQVIDSGLDGEPAFTPILVSFSDPSDTIESLTIEGTDGSGGPRAWLIDDLSVTTAGGVRRLQIEWDITGLGTGSNLTSADVVLHTNKGTIDSLDTFFFVGTEEQDGLLTASDFEAPVEEIPGVVMPVPAVPTGTDGTFTFDVLSQLQSVLNADSVTHFSIQGRVDEGLLGQGFLRGLQVRTTADGNVTSFLTPQLSLTTPGVVASPITFSITSLPLNGTLFDSFGTTITTVPTTLSSSLVTYQPNTQFVGVDSFGFQVNDGSTTDTALVTVVVESGFGFGSCVDNEIYCYDGRN